MKFRYYIIFFILFVSSIFATYLYARNMIKLEYQGMVVSAEHKAKEAEKKSEQAISDMEVYKRKIDNSSEFGKQTQVLEDKIAGLEDKITELEDINETLKNEEENLKESHKIEVEKLDNTIEELNKEIKGLNNDINKVKAQKTDILAENSKIKDDNIKLSNSRKTKVYEVSTVSREYITIDDAQASNIILALNNLDSWVIKPGGTFSLYKSIVDPQTDYEYNVDGRHPDYINGIEYVATALYNEAIRLNFDIVESHEDSNNNIFIDKDNDLIIKNTTNNKYTIKCSFYNSRMSVILK